MSAQYSLFDGDGGRLVAAPTGAGVRAAGGVGPYTADERRDLDVALGAPPDLLPPKPPQGWRGPLRGMRFLKIGLANRTSIVVETELSMLELSNELRQKGKLRLTLASGHTTEVRAQDVAYLENVYRVPV